MHCTQRLRVARLLTAAGIALASALAWVLVALAAPAPAAAQRAPDQDKAAPPAGKPGGGQESGPGGGQPAGQPGGAGDAAGGAAPAGTGPELATAEESHDVDALRQEYLRLRDELFRSRARAATVASALYSTQLRVNLTYDSGRFYTVTRATIRLDGASVYDDTGGAIAGDRAPRFEGFVAPGRHVIGIRIEATGKDDERFTSIIDDTFVIQAPAGKDVTVTARARDGGDIPYAWQRKERGSYKLGLDVEVATAARPQGTGGGAGKSIKRGNDAGPKK